MSPEQVGILVTAFASLIGTIIYILRQISNTRNEARREAIAAKARQDKIENDARAERLAARTREDEADNRQREIISAWAVEFKQELSKTSEKLTDALIKNAHLEGQIDILMKNQDAANRTIAAYGKRISELEADGKFKDNLIEKITSQRDTIQQKYEDGRDRMIAMTIELNQLKSKATPVTKVADTKSINKADKGNKS